MLGVRCDVCGSQPWVVQHDGRMYLRCECDDALDLGAAKPDSRIPEPWILERGDDTAESE